MRLTALSRPRSAEIPAFWPALLLVTASLAGYLAFADHTLRLGFPLDDAWIHQTYARNLALLGEWSFIPGQPSAGSTAPVWSALLALGYLFRLEPFVWTFALGWAVFLALILVGAAALRFLCPARSAWAPWAAALLAVEWHLVWAAASGMETLLFALFALLVLGWLLSGRQDWFRLGLLVGLAAWIRPDGLTLAGPVLWVIFSSGHSGPVQGAPRPWRSRLFAGGSFVMGMLVLFLPYLVFNRLLAGAWWPNTFFAKQAEYAVHRQLPLLERAAAQAVLPLTGVGAVLLPGFVLRVATAWRRREWAVVAGALWAAGYLMMYALRLPVVYQHGRYVIPAMPVYFIWGAAGMFEWVNPAGNLMKRVVTRAWLFSAALLLLVFWVLGAQAYGRDVAVIETEMVATARWVAANTQPSDLVAAHDIGALGYFAGRPLLDLAGLVSPEVIPFIRDESRLQAFLDERQADYLVAFPGWYPQLVGRAERVYQTGGHFSPAVGGENMSVFRWAAP